jgi:general stress protein 26
MPDDKQILETACQIINDAFVGVFTTVDEHAAPFSRLMGAVADDDGPHRLYSLSAKDTRKTAHLEKNPHVSWVFSLPPYDTTVMLRGRAKLSETPNVPQPTWDRLADWARPYAANVLTDDSHHSFAVIVSNIHTLEMLSPRMGIKAPHIIRLDRFSDDD